MKLQGIIPPLVTPFRADESLDLETLKKHIDWQLACGADAVFLP
jgi:dihydrodipicolinate synthase/N-acetylneuraminate lyase